MLRLDAIVLALVEGRRCFYTRTLYAFVLELFVHSSQCSCALVIELFVHSLQGSCAFVIELFVHSLQGSLCVGSNQDSWA